MERMTSRNEDCVLVNGHALGCATVGEIVQMAERLAAYEDMDSKRLRELAEADKGGRVIILPCKVGNTVYTNNRVLGTDGTVYDDVCARKIKGYGGNALNEVWLIASGEYCDFSIFPSEFGKTVFLTREEAERAVEGRKDG